MSIAPEPHPKLEELQRLAQEYNRKLIDEFPRLKFLSKGGDLFLGKHYCESSRIFLGLNPGGREAKPFKTDLREEGNFWDDPNREYPYWKNCRSFVKPGSRLHEWITTATVAYCCPWRTRDGRELYKLDAQTGGRLFQYCGELLRRLVKDHKETFPDTEVVLVVPGRATLHLLSSQPFLDIKWRDHLRFDNGTRGTYQWAKVEWDDIVLYQVPHFSRANSAQRLTECAEWLVGDLELRQPKPPGVSCR
jgi:hypothetical protein